MSNDNGKESTVADALEWSLGEAKRIEGAPISLDTAMLKSSRLLIFNYDRTEVLRIGMSGVFFVHGQLAESDKQIVDALREWARKAETL